MSVDGIWIMVTGSLVALCCGLLGCYLVLRKMAMVGDAISHAVLPGVILAYVLTESRNSIPMLVGAALLGVLTTFMIEWFHKKVKLSSDASIGISFTLLFAIGVILTNMFTGGNVDIDQDCVLYGDIIDVPLNQWIVGSNQDYSLGPITTWIMGGTLILLIILVRLGYRGLFITTFNPEYAAALGISTTLFHYALMSAVSLTTVVSFESVGAILVVAFLVIPPATAYLLTDRLKRMFVYTAIFGVSSSVLGYLLAWGLNSNIAGAMAVVAASQFAIVFVLSRRTTVLRRWKQHKQDEPAPLPSSKTA